MVLKENINKLANPQHWKFLDSHLQMTDHRLTKVNLKVFLGVKPKETITYIFMIN